MTRNAVSPSVPLSKMVTTLGCCSPAAVRASRTNRSKAARSPCGSNCCTLTATFPAEHRVMRRPDMTHPARPDPPVQPIPPDQQDLRVHTRHPTPPGVPYLDGGREGGLRHCAALSADGLGYASCPRIVPVGHAVVWTLT